MRSWLFISGLVLLAPLLHSQHANQLIRQGNKQYESGNYQDAEVKYIKSQQGKGASYKGVYNAGTASYQQKNYAQAAASFDSARMLHLDEGVRSDLYYNLGNSFLKYGQDSVQEASKALPASIAAYKEALRLNPDDQEAKYNLAYAQKLLQQQQQNQDQQQQNQDEQQQNQDQQQQNQDQQQQNQDQQQNEEQQQQQQKQQQQSAQKISKEDAARILEAMKNDEKKTLEKIERVKVKAAPAAKSEKDW